jgi:hypothetical protein
MKNLALILVAGIGLSSGAAAQSPTEQLKGRWVYENKAGYCGRSIYDITFVDANGTVRGKFTCEKTNYVRNLGEAANSNSVKATFTGNHFVMVNSDGGGNDLILNGTKLEGTGKVTSASSPNPTTYIKE